MSVIFLFIKIYQQLSTGNQSNVFGTCVKVLWPVLLGISYTVPHCSVKNVIFTHELSANQSTVLFFTIASCGVVELFILRIDKQRQNCSRNQKEHENTECPTESQILPETLNCRRSILLALFNHAKQQHQLSLKFIDLRIILFQSIKLAETLRQSNNTDSFPYWEMYMYNRCKKLF